jgi:hypothetical protein
MKLGGPFVVVSILPFPWTDGNSTQEQLLLARVAPGKTLSHQLRNEMNVTWRLSRAIRPAPHPKMAAHRRGATKAYLATVRLVQ